MYAKVYEFITNKLQLMKIMPLDKKAFEETKIIKMIQELGEGFKEFLSANPTVEIGQVLIKATNGIITVNKFLIL